MRAPGPSEPVPISEAASTPTNTMPAIGVRRRADTELDDPLKGALQCGPDVARIFEVIAEGAVIELLQSDSTGTRVKFVPIVIAPARGQSSTDVAGVCERYSHSSRRGDRGGDGEIVSVSAAVVRVPLPSDLTSWITLSFVDGAKGSFGIRLHNPPKPNRTPHHFGDGTRMAETQELTDTRYQRRCRTDNVDVAVRTPEEAP